MQQSETYGRQSILERQSGQTWIRLRKTYQSIATHIALNVEVLTQSSPLEHHGDPVQVHGACEAEQPAVGVAHVDLLRVVGRVDVKALRSAAVKARCAAP